MAVEGLGVHGEGVGRLDGEVVFVPGAFPGDRLRVRVTAVRPRYARAEVLEIVSPSPDRVEPACPHQAVCGGCPLMALRSETAFRLKTDLLLATVRRVGGVSELLLGPPLPMPDPWGYRRKTAHPAGRTARGLLLGFYAAGSHRLVDVSSCPVAALENRLARRAAEEVLQGVPPYRETDGRGELRHVVIRSNRKGRVMLTLVVRSRLPEQDRLAAELVRRVPGLESLYLNRNGDPGNIILGREFHRLAGSGHLLETLDGLTFRISPASFFQVNPVMAEVLYQVVEEEAGLGGNETVLDLYSGTGTIALWLARRARRVAAVEEVPAAVRDARENARLNGLEVDFRTGTAEEVLPELANAGFRPDVVTMDPPRSGVAEAALTRLAEISPRRIVYVSCWPATLARDLGRLRGAGYRLLHLRPVDLFPHTAHIETVATLVRD